MSSDFSSVIFCPKGSSQNKTKQDVQDRLLTENQPYLPYLYDVIQVFKQ